MNNELVGFVALSAKGQHLCLDHLYVEPVHQDAGIGSTVLTVVIEEARVSGKALHVGALRESPSNHFYVRHGFKLERQEAWDNYYVLHPNGAACYAFHERSIPVLPSRSLRRTIHFYEQLGFVGTLLAADTYAIVTRGDLELHFFPHPDLQPTECYAGAYMRVAEVDALHQAFASAHLPTTGIPRLEAVEDKPWRMREFALLDEDGNLIKVGRPIARLDSVKPVS